MNNKIRETIKILQQQRPVFHSEDDFKFEFSRVLSQLLGDNYEIRLERPTIITMVKRDGSKPPPVRAPIDIIVINKEENTICPIELKYKTKLFETTISDEIYDLKAQGAPDRGRFSFRKDIYRVEQLVLKENNIPYGYFIVITNEDLYLHDISTKNNLDKNYSFHQDAILHKNDLGWNYEKQIHDGYILNKHELIKNNKKHWTSTGNEFYKLDLQGTYQIKWEDYSENNSEKFHMSIVKVGQ